MPHGDTVAARGSTEVGDAPGSAQAARRCAGEDEVPGLMLAARGSAAGVATGAGVGGGDAGTGGEDRERLASWGLEPALQPGEPAGRQGCGGPMGAGTMSVISKKSKSVGEGGVGCFAKGKID